MADITAKSPRTILNVKYMAYWMYCPDWSIDNPSLVKVLNVVKPPQRPTVSSKRTSVLHPIRITKLLNNPIKKQPATLHNKVPTGKPDTPLQLRVYSLMR